VLSHPTGAAQEMTWDGCEAIGEVDCDEMA